MLEDAQAQGRRPGPQLRQQGAVGRPRGCQARRRSRRASSRAPPRVVLSTVITFGGLGRFARSRRALAVRLPLASWRASIRARWLRQARAATRRVHGDHCASRWARPRRARARRCSARPPRPPSPRERRRALGGARGARCSHWRCDATALSATSLASEGLQVDLCGILISTGDDHRLAGLRAAAASATPSVPAVARRLKFLLRIGARPAAATPRRRRRRAGGRRRRAGRRRGRIQWLGGGEVSGVRRRATRSGAAASARPLLFIVGGWDASRDFAVGVQRRRRGGLARITAPNGRRRACARLVALPERLLLFGGTDARQLVRHPPRAPPAPSVPPALTQAPRGSVVSGGGRLRAGGCRGGSGAQRCVFACPRARRRTVFGQAGARSAVERALGRRRPRLFVFAAGATRRRRRAAGERRARSALHHRRWRSADWLTAADSRAAIERKGRAGARAAGQRRRGRRRSELSRVVLSSAPTSPRDFGGVTERLQRGRSMAATAASAACSAVALTSRTSDVDMDDVTQMMGHGRDRRRRRCAGGRNRPIDGTLSLRTPPHRRHDRRRRRCAALC